MRAAAARRRADDALRADTGRWSCFAGGAVARTGLLFGLFPALQSTRPDLVTTLRAGSGKLAGARVGGALPQLARHGADRAVDGAARLGGTVRQEPRNVSKVDLG